MLCHFVSTHFVLLLVLSLAVSCHSAYTQMYTEFDRLMCYNDWLTFKIVRILIGLGLGPW